MPNIFKALASITAWTLFILSAIALLSGYVRMFGAVGGVDLTPPGLPQPEFAMGCGFVGLAISVVVMVLRKKME